MKKRDILKWSIPIVTVVMLPVHAQTTETLPVEPLNQPPVQPPVEQLDLEGIVDLCGGELPDAAEVYPNVTDPDVLESLQAELNQQYILKFAPTRVVYCHKGITSCSTPNQASFHKLHGDPVGQCK